MRKKLLNRVASGVFAIALGSILAQAAAPAAPQGVITAKAFLDIGGGAAVTDLTGNAKFPDSPDLVQYPGYFELWATGDIATPPGADVFNNYGSQIVGYFYPPSTGDYVFYLSSDDGSNLYLSTDDTAANKKLIAQEAGYSGVRSYTAIGGTSTVEAKNSSTFTGTEWPTKDSVLGGAIITLTQGKAYYIEALHKEGGGGDNLSVAVQDPNFEIDATAPIPGAYLSSFDKATGPLTIVTQPQSQTVTELTPVTFSVAVDGTPPYTYQWKRNGSDVTGPTNMTYTIARASLADNGAKFSVAVAGAQGNATSADATLTVTADTTAPTIVEAAGGADRASVRVKFSEWVTQATAENANNYKIDQGITVSAAKLAPDNVTVILTTSTQTDDTLYNLTVNGVQDTAAAANTIATDSKIAFRAAKFITGIAKWERWNDLNGDTGNIDTFVANLDDPAWGRIPDVTGTSSSMGSPWGVADNYGCRVTTYFVPPTTGNYVFFQADDDQGVMFLSTDDKPENKKMITRETVWSNTKEWTITGGSSDLTAKRSDQYADGQWPNYNPITLTAGKRYYLELDFREGTGGDGCDATYIMEGDADPANGTTALTGDVIGMFASADTLSPLIVKRPRDFNPADVTVFNKGDTLTFKVQAESSVPITYQWLRNKQAIPGANSDTLTISNADATAVGDYLCQVSNKNGMVETYPDDDARAIMADGFLIEAEDFNYNTGQAMPAANTMPYKGDAYKDLTSQAVLDVDYYAPPDRSAAAALAYNRFLSSDAGVADMKGGTPDSNNDAGVVTATARNRGASGGASWSVDANYAIGWTAVGQWQNYTRIVPAGKYAIIAGIAADGRAAGSISQSVGLVANPTIADGGSQANNIVTPGNLQGVTKIGDFVSTGTGAWSSNDLLPATKADGSIATVDLSGTVTLRWMSSHDGGDMDFLMLYPAPESGGGVGTARITLSGTNVTVSEDPAGGSTVQSATTVLGPWTDLGPAPQTEAVGTGAKFYRLKK